MMLWSDNVWCKHTDIAITFDQCSNNNKMVKTSASCHHDKWSWRTSHHSFFLHFFLPCLRRHKDNHDKRDNTFLTTSFHVWRWEFRITWVQETLALCCAIDLWIVDFATSHDRVWPCTFPSVSINPYAEVIWPRIPLQFKMHQKCIIERWEEHNNN